MKKHYAIAIPKPCYEDWNSMTPNERGRFCNSCVKTVVDFTKMSTEDIQTYIETHKHQRICGHFKQSQLDSINLRIPSQIIVKPKNVHKVFLLALLLVMGTTLLNCTNNKGNKQKIDSVEVVDSLQNKVVDSVKYINELIKKDSIIPKTCTKPPQIPAPHPTGITVIETVGEVVSDTIPELMIDGDIEIMGGIGPEEEPVEEEPLFFGMISETPPEFKDTPENLSISESKSYFQNKLSKIVGENFNTSVCLGLKGKQKINTRFTVNKEGKIVDIKVRAPQPALEKEAIRVIKLLPDFIPATQRNKPVNVLYDLPIIFNVDN
ncbi:energy transducer TonB [Aestuariibaculum sediminum]|uniref:Energy transducer TonB n=1 Tax=Aestuariibaculum sediminum TaxID=2770637 RepID=A0A8J6U9R0_9FLAO|nr:energy transducer TonB [Aestuariibaculum sediminum]MBD0833552.1 energy transducer TonB [Aestuariibaculum sediminum]